MPAPDAVDESERLPEQLRRPFKVALAKAVERMPGEEALPGGTVYEPKWDGFRLVIARDGGDTALWSRQQKDLTRSFPEIVEAASRLIPAGFAVDGEVVRWNENRLDFDALQRRLSTSPRTVVRLVNDEPVSYVAFDLVAVAGRDLRGHPFHVRRTLLEELARSWDPPLSLSPSTGQREEAERWMQELPEKGMEGVVAKGRDQRYNGGQRDWQKLRHRDTVELVAGAVSGSLADPEALILGRYVDGTLRIVGRTTPIRRAGAGGLISRLREPAGEHPWPDTISSTSYDRFNKKTRTPVTLIEPIVVEVSADTSLVGGSLRHPARFVRVRPEV